MLNFETLAWGTYSTILVRRGIIKCDYQRAYRGNPLGPRDHEELTAILAEIRDLFKLAPPK